MATINGFSAHAGQDFLVEYAKAVKDTAKRVYLVHGEDRPARVLEERLDEAGVGRVYYPERGALAEL